MPNQTSIAPWGLKDPMSNEQAENIISAVARRSLSPGALAWLQGKDDPATPVLSNAYQQVVWVYRAINLLAEQIANIPFLFSQGERGRENLITSGPLAEFYNRPHPHINRFQYWELRIIWLMLRGECFRIPIYHDTRQSGIVNRKLFAVLILDPAHFHHIIQNGDLVGWRYTGFGPDTPLESQVFLPEEVWFEKLPNPFDFWRGMPPLYTAEVASKTDFAAASFMKGLMENNGDVGLVVRTDQQLSKDQRAQLFAALSDRKRRAGTADRPLLLWGGAQVVRPELSSADLQFLENRRFSRSEICAAFGVPEELVSTTAYNKYDVMAGARQNFIENRIAPLCSRLEAEENATTIPALVGTGRQRTLTGWFDLDSLPIMQQARRARLAAAKIGFDMGIPFNELNRAFDLGFKPFPWGDTPYLPSTYHPLTPPTPNLPSKS
jgi:HK97 family phage portal protein